jgi:hypothetical protein
MFVRKSQNRKRNNYNYRSSPLIEEEISCAPSNSKPSSLPSSFVLGDALLHDVEYVTNGHTRVFLHDPNF